MRRGRRAVVGGVVAHGILGACGGSGEGGAHIRGVGGDATTGYYRGGPGRITDGSVSSIIALCSILSTTAAAAAAAIQLVTWICSTFVI